MAETFVSLLETTVNGAIGSGSTTLTVDDASRFPADPEDNFYITVFDPTFSSASAAFTAGKAEVMRISGKSGSNLTVVRGQEGTSAIAIGDGWQVIHVFGPTNISNKILTSSIVDGFAGGTSAPGSAENDKVLNETKVQMVTLLHGDGATDVRRWYRVAEFLRSQGNEIHFSVHNADRLATGIDSEIYTFCVRNSNDPPDVQYSKTGVAGMFPGRVVITDDGTNIGVYVRVDRFGNATVASNQFVINRTVNGELEATEIGQGTAVPASISADVVFDTNSDAPNATVEFGDILIGGKSIQEVGSWTPTDGSGAGLTFSTATAIYAVSGNICFVSFRVDYPATADTNRATISGFPFTVHNFGLTEIYSGNLLTNLAGSVAGIRAVLNTSGDIVFRNDPSFAAMNNDDFSGKQLRGNIVLRID